MIFRNDDISPAASPLEVTDHLEIDRYETRLVILNTLFLHIQIPH